MKRVVYHKLAANELIESAEFYEKRRPMLGEAFLLEIETAVRHVQLSPESGRAGKHQTRSYRVRRFPFRIVYHVQADRIWIVALAHLSRKPGYWRRRTA